MFTALQSLSAERSSYATEVSSGHLYTAIWLYCLFLLRKLIERCSGFQTRPSQNDRRSCKTLFVSENSRLCSPKLVCPVSFRSHKNASTCDIKKAYEGPYDFMDRNPFEKSPKLTSFCMTDFVLAVLPLGELWMIKSASPEPNEESPRPTKPFTLGQWVVWMRYTSLAAMLVCTYTCVHTCMCMCDPHASCTCIFSALPGNCLVVSVLWRTVSPSGFEESGPAGLLGERLIYQ